MVLDRLRIAWCLWEGTRWKRIAKKYPILPDEIFNSWLERINPKLHKDYEDYLAAYSSSFEPK